MRNVDIAVLTDNVFDGIERSYKHILPDLMQGYIIQRLYLYPIIILLQSCYKLMTYRSSTCKPYLWVYKE